MVNRPKVRRAPLDRAAPLVGGYVLVVVATIVALAVLSALDCAQATDEAWGHAVLVAVFAVLLPLRLRAARRGSRRATLVVGTVAAILVVVNLVEAAIPGLFPGWMRVEMIGIAVLTGAIALAAYQAAKHGGR